MPISTQQRSAYNLRMPTPALITPSTPKMLTFNTHHLTPITTLPPEILEAIFKICISWLYQPRPYTSSQTPPAQNTHLAWTQVCSAWRLISLSSPRLWRTIDLAASPCFTISSIKKSKNALIDIISSTPLYGLLRLFSNENQNDASHATSPVLSSLRSNAYRIRSIDLFLFASDMYALFHTTFPFPLPNLTSLTLKLPPLSRTVVLPLSLPLVRHLSLEGVALNRAAWSELRELRYLSLKGLDEESCPSIEELLAILQRSPALEHLILEDYRPSSPKIPIPNNDHPIQTEPPDPISLPHLKHLTISSSQPILTSLFSPKHHLILTPHTRIRLFGSLSDDLHTIFPHGKLPWAYDYNARRGPSSVKQVRLSLSPGDQVHDRRCSDSERNGIQPSFSSSASSNPIIISTIRLSKNGAHFLTPHTPAWITDAQIGSQAQSPILFSLSSARPVGTRICASLPHLLGNKLGWIIKLELNTGVLTTSNTTNKFGNSDGIHEDALRPLFENLPSLETLCIAFNDLGSLWKVLTLSPPLTQISPLPQHILLPRLKNLSFSKPSEVWTHFSERWSTPLVKFIKSRSTPHQANTAVQPIEAVEFLRCQGVRNHTRQSESEDENEEMCELRRLVRDVIVRDEMGAKSQF